MPELRALRLTGAKILRDGTLVDDVLCIAGTKITDSAAIDIDLRGYYILPGIVDLHGDGFERHLQPRPNVHIDKRVGLISTDAELAANGITTAVLAQCWSWLGGRRSPEYATDLLKVWSADKHRSLVDMRFQIRYETHMLESAETMLQVLLEHNVEYLVFNNHINDAIDAQRTAPSGFAAYATEAGRTTSQHATILEEMLSNSFGVNESLEKIAATLKFHGIRFGSHDDATASKRRYFDGLGADICEFPTTIAAAEQARALNNAILMGAPNVMRGGSQSGNVSAQNLIEAGLCDALVSDYYYPAMQGAVWALSDRGILSFEQAWALISTKPAAILGLGDRGQLTKSARADFVILNPETRRIEATISNGHFAALSGEAGVRFSRPATPLSIAAE
ncbi:hypothetical protein A9Q96_04990 [Rhodobacterales bacterium 52_120_T64]|nr:hypothetical protein A9Q96_04990 [Rhodobacterales bacterium 52_120_T64]